MVKINDHNDFLTSCGPLSGGGGNGGGSGTAGKSAYQYAVEHGYTGTEDEFGQALNYAGTAYQISDVVYHSLVLGATSVDEVNQLFAEWWSANISAAPSKAALIQRWFGNVLYDDRVHGVKFPLFSTSTSAIGELTDDSAGLSCTPSTASVAGNDDFAHLPQFWTLEVSMERSMDGGHEIIKVEHIDDLADVRSGNYGLCQVLQKNTWVKEWKDDSYHYMQMCCDPEDKTGWHTWPQGTNKNGTVYSYIANPKYYAGRGKNGIITCGTGLTTVNYTSHNNGVLAWRERGAQYSGAAGNLLKWQLSMIWLKYARKGNSGTIEGCSNFYRRHKAKVSETGVERIIVSTSEGKNLLVGCNVHIGTSSEGYQIARDVLVSAIEDIEIGGAAYAAVYVDNGGVTFDTVADTTYISTMPWNSGRNDDVLGYDGSHTNYTNGWEPGLIQRTEFQNGAYLILSDELWQWSKDEDGNYLFDCYTCHDQSRVTTNGAISDDYTKQDDLTMVFPADTTNSWKYIEDMAIANDPGVIWPEAVSTAAGSGTGVKAAMGVYPAASGVRAAWCCHALGNGGFCGLAARYSYNSPADSSWTASVGCPSGISG